MPPLSPASSNRVTHQPAYMLHRYDWSESSLILETFTRDFGRIALVARGAKRPSSNFRPVLLPLQPLSIGFGGDAEIRTLKGAEWVGGQVMPTGDALLAGYHVNELLMRLLARDDPHPRLFDAYERTVQVLAGEHGGGDSPAVTGAGELLEPALRAFELVLLREIGLLPALDRETATLAPLEDDAAYRLVPEGGLVRIASHDERRGDTTSRERGDMTSRERAEVTSREREGRAALAGRDWRAIEAALVDEAPFGRVLREVARTLQPLKSELRALLHHHCGVSALKTRQMMMDLQAL